MSAARKTWSLGWRVGVAALLLAWVFHAIFHDQCRALLAEEGQELDTLPRGERWGLVWRLGPKQLWRTIVQVHPGWLAASVVLWGVTILLGIWRWQVILRSQGLTLGFRRTAEISLVAHFFNSFLLGSTGGDLLKAYYAAQVTHHKKTEAVTTVVMDRLIGLFAMLAFAAVMALANLPLVGAYRRVQALAWLILAMLAAVGFLLLLSLRGGFSRWFPSARARLRRLPKGEVVERALEAFRSLGRNRRLLWQALGLALLLNFVCVLQFLTLVWGYRLELPLGPIFFVIPAVICVSALPLTPSGLGVRDNLYVYLLTVPMIGVSAAKALAMSLVAYAASLLWSLLGGIVYVALRREPELIDAVRAEHEAEDVTEPRRSASGLASTPPAG